MQKSITFTAHGSSAATGNFAPGDTLLCDAAAAKHYVEEAACAEYTKPKGKAAEPADAAAAAKAPPATSTPRKAATNSAKGGAQ